MKGLLKAEGAAASGHGYCGSICLRDFSCRESRDADAGSCFAARFIGALYSSVGVNDR